MSINSVLSNIVNLIMYLSDSKLNGQWKRCNNFNFVFIPPPPCLCVCTSVYVIYMLHYLYDGGLGVRNCSPQITHYTDNKTAEQSKDSRGGMKQRVKIMFTYLISLTSHWKFISIEHFSVWTKWDSDLTSIFILTSLKYVNYKGLSETC